MTIKPHDRRPEWYAVFGNYFTAYAGPRGGDTRERPKVVDPDWDTRPLWSTPAEATEKAAAIADAAQEALAAYDANEAEKARPK